MLKTPSEFPHAGSYALYRALYQAETVKVRIIRRAENGDCFISGKGVCTTVPLHRLIAFEAPRPAIEQWADQRIIAVGGGILTRAGDVYADYCTWFARMLPADIQLNRSAFARTLLTLGFRSVRASVGGGMSNCWAFALSESQRSAA